MRVATFQLGDERTEPVPPYEEAKVLEAARRREGWLEDGRTFHPESRQWYYRWKYDPDKIRAEDKENRLIGVLAVLGIGVAIFVGVAYAVSNRDTNTGNDASAPASKPRVPINSEGKPAVGPVPAPPDDPCWRQTEEAVEASPSDGGQSAMPQRCIDKGF